MTPGKVRASTILQKSAQVNAMLVGIQGLPLGTFDEFTGDPRNPAAAESYLRRALEGLLDLARHILAKGMGQAPAEYKEVAALSTRAGLVSGGQGDLMMQIAGYCNRLTHFYDEVSQRELYDICSSQMDDVHSLLDALLEWVRAHPDSIDGEL
ncbi:MAG: DUF86 domain-containing protein [Thermoleophilia bacterium]|nr:DUF86 domain-containing protein [Thermoleophilia bacterium]